MDTIRLNVNPWNPEEALIAEAVRVLKSGGLVAFPTETVYGLGADGLNSKAVKDIYRAKGRPSDNPLILHLSSPDEADLYALPDERAYKVMRHFWPGPLTIVLPARTIVPEETRGGLDTVALRMPDHPVALSLIERAGFPLAAPSANSSGRPSPTDAEAVLADLGGRIDMLLDSGPVQVGLESTVLDLSSEKPTLLRPGGMPKEELEAFLGGSLSSPDKSDEKSSRRSPGTRYRHYAPEVPVLIWHTEKTIPECSFERCGFMGLDVPPVIFGKFILFENYENYARGLFAGLRRLEGEGVESIVVQWPEEAGLGLAIRDRIWRAAQGTKPI